MRRFTTIVLCCVLLFTTARLDAWGGEGHQVVALIAEERLTEAAKSGIHELLGDDVNISDAEIASWADQIKRQRRRTSPWHYVNIPLEAAGYDPKRDGKDGNNIIERIGSFETLLADRSKPKEARSEALKFLVHLVGDVHQPLHCVERNGDKGGNSCQVFMPEQKGKATNLHKVWDTTLLRSFISRTRIAEYSLGLSKQVSEEQENAWSSGDAIAWANESKGVAEKSVYPGVPEGEVTRLNEKYVKDSQPVIEQQLERGGVRLAVVLNRAFATTRPTTQP